MEPLSFVSVESIEQIGQHHWQRIVGHSLPFMRYEFLAALESSGAVSATTGWKVQHLLIKAGEQIIALMPLYEKSHSYGEYVFDWAWAEAYERNGLEYYPKLLNAIPFTPAIGNKLAFAQDIDKDTQQAVIEQLIAYLQTRVQDDGYSGWHGLFVSEGLAKQYQATSVTQRLGTQFHWHNNQYQDFDDFLGSMTSRKRKNIRKERRQLAKHNLTFSMVNGHEISAADWQDFYHCYMHTYLKRSGHSGYLNQAFFTTIGITMADSVRLLKVTQHKEPGENDQSEPQQQLIAAALFFESETHLYGRYWGALKEIEGLHFEACYYQGIEYAIAQQLAVFDAGAQGEHKVLRGFTPVPTHSVHFVDHPQFQAAIDNYCAQEQRDMQLYMQQLSQVLPYKA